MEPEMRRQIIQEVTFMGRTGGIFASFKGRIQFFTGESSPCISIFHPV
jgi:hypothetical protein